MLQSGLIPEDRFRTAFIKHEREGEKSSQRMSFGFFRLLSHALLCFDNSIPKEICQPVNIHFVLLPNILICHLDRNKILHKKTGFITIFSNFFNLFTGHSCRKDTGRYVNRLLSLYPADYSPGPLRIASCSLFSSQISCLAFQNRFVSVRTAFSAIPDTPAPRMEDSALSSSRPVSPEKTSIS